MSLHRRNPRRDANELEIVGVLRSVGAVVYRLSDTGIPDLLVGWNCRWRLMEIKLPHGRDRQKQVEFSKNAAYHGLPCHRVCTIEDALRALGLEP